MFKRIFAFFTVLFLGLVLTFHIPIKAASPVSIPFSSVKNLIDAFYTIASGGTIDIATVFGKVTNIDSFIDGLTNYYNDHYNPDLLSNNRSSVDLAISVLALAGLGNITDSGQLIFKANAADLANFMGYNVNWIKRYKYEDGITVNPDLDYLNYLERINGNGLNGFYWYDYPSISGSSYPYSANIHPFYSYSWFAVGNTSNLNNTIFNTPNIAANQGIWAFASDIISIYINSSVSGVYSYSLSVNALNNTNKYVYNNTQYQAFDFKTSEMSGYESYPWSGLGFTLQNPYSASYTGSLDGVLNHIANRFKNVNIYVDGVLWSYVGTTVVDGITLDNPVNIGNTDGITYNSFPLDRANGIDLAKWAYYLYDFVTANPDGTLSIGDVINNEWDIVDTDTGEDTTITGDDAEDVSKVIAGAISITGGQTTPTPTPPYPDPPVLKIIPPIIDPVNEIWPDGGRDTTVLAQMVHATDTVIPNDIMTIIWSTIGLLVVGGIISILHK